MKAQRFISPGLLICLWIAFWAQVACAESDPAFWRVDGKRGSVYLFGSVHFGRPSFFPLPAAINQAFDRSDVLAVEVDITQIDPKRAERALMQHGQLPAGQTLRALLSPQTYEQLTKVCARRGLPVSAFERFQPWFAALQLVLSEIRASPLEQSLGLDLHFLKRVGQHRIDELESFEGQLRLSAEASLAEQAALLARTLEDLESSQDYLMSLASAWQRGDLAALQSSLVEPFQSDPLTQSLYQQMFVERNRAMTSAIEAYLGSNETVFFVVGAGHLIGPDGIVSRLNQLGYSVRRLN